MVRRLIFCISFLSVLFSCTPEDGVDGRDGTNGQDGVDGQDGFSIGLVSTDLGNGCRELNFFRDSNNNGVQESNESSITTFEVCDGISPNIKMISQDNESCSNGGKIFTFFNDVDDDGELDSNENILGSNSICNGVDGVDGVDGSAAGSYSIFVKETSSATCSNGGFEVSVFQDLNGNGTYEDVTESVSSVTLICFPSKESIDIPDYSELGHSYSILGVWRLYSAIGIPVQEKDRFNIHIYPDSSNPNLLVENRSNQTGWLEFPIGSEPIGWSSQFMTTPNRDELYFDHNKIDGVDASIYSSYKDKDRLVYYKGSNTSFVKYITIYIPDGAVDYDKYPSGLRSLVFYKID